MTQTPSKSNTRQDPSKSKYYLRWKGQRQGPYTCAQIKGLLAGGEVSRHHELYDGQAWIAVDDFFRQQELLAIPPPPGSADTVKNKHKGEFFYYSLMDNQYMGPYDFRALDALFAEGSIPPYSNIYRTVTREWIGQESYKALSSSRTKGQDRKAETNFRKRLRAVFDFSSFRNLLSEIFKPHSLEEMEERFTVYPRTMEQIFPDGVIRWPKPWLFFRVMALNLLLAVGVYWSLLYFESEKLVPLWFFVAALSIPLGTLVFFFECNVLRNLSVFKVILLFISGGVISLFITLGLNEFLYKYTEGRFHNLLGASSAGIIEESAKLLAVVIVSRNWLKNRNILNGLLMGAAVGTGFAVFETMGYIFGDFLKNFAQFIATKVQEGESAQIMLFDPLGLITSIWIWRGISSIGTHIVWTAITTAALWKVVKKDSIKMEHFFDFRFLPWFIFPIILHMLWNSQFYADTEIDWIYSRLVLIAVGWIGVAILMNQGLKQIEELED